MLLIAEIAAGVFLGLLAYQSLAEYARKHDLTVLEVVRGILGYWFWLAAFVALLGFVGAFLYLVYLFLTHPHETKYFYAFLGMGISGYVLFILYAAKSDRKARLRAQAVGERTNCSACGATGIQFKRFEGGLKAPAGAEYDHPMGMCRRCGHEQELGGG
ncbi:MAG: hypothetical protein ACYDD2_10990 [Candidatus Acidiferrales bacterium]